MYAVQKRYQSSIMLDCMIDRPVSVGEYTICKLRKSAANTTTQCRRNNVSGIGLAPPPVTFCLCARDLFRLSDQPALRKFWSIKSLITASETQRLCVICESPGHCVLLALIDHGPILDRAFYFAPGQEKTPSWDGSLDWDRRFATRLLPDRKPDGPVYPVSETRLGYTSTALSSF